MCICVCPVHAGTFTTVVQTAVCSCAHACMCVAHVCAHTYVHAYVWGWGWVKGCAHGCVCARARMCEGQMGGGDGVQRCVLNDFSSFI